MNPPPAGVRDNEWHRVALPPPDLFRPGTPVSVVVPYYEQPAELERTLAALERQTWPRELFEVVVVDDGSKTPLAVPPSPLRVTVVHQEDRGFGLARARNAGVQTAAHDILLFLDADMLPEAGWIAAHARWHHAVCDAVTLGSRSFVAVEDMDAETIRARRGSLRELFADRPWDTSFVTRHMARTRHLTARGDDQFRVLVGSNFGIRRELFEAAGGFDETFTRWGGEDTEFGYRAQTIGALLVPLGDGFAWHQGRLAEDRERKDESQDIQRGKLAHLIAHQEFRAASPGRTFAVPQYVVTIDAAQTHRSRILEVAERVLAGRTSDLVVRIALGDDERLPWLREHLGPDPRIRIAPRQSALDEFPAAAFHVEIPATVRIAPDVVRRMRAALGSAASAVAPLGDGSTASITRAWALHRARRNGSAVDRFGEVLLLSPRRLGVALAVQRGGRGPRWQHLRHRIGQVRVKIGQVRSPKQAWWFLAWLAGAVRWRLARWELFRRRRPPATEPARSPRSAPVLGVRIATQGTAAAAVLRAHRGQDDAQVDILLTDAPLRTRTLPTVSLADAPPMLSVPAFNAAVDNPIGWIRAVAPVVGALGPLDRLPAAGVAAQHVVDNRDSGALRWIHHLEDVATYHRSAVERAGELARLAARGVVVHLADGGEELRPLLGDDLHRLMLGDIALGDLAARERLSIAMRRAALRKHALDSRIRQIAALAMDDPPRLPLVSILLATKRPQQLPAALAAVARQSYPRLELVLAAHGDGFADAEQALEALPCPWQLVRVPSSRSFGGALNAATEAAHGTLVAKMDDDDLYAAEHIWDLVLARGYSRAELVGKGLEYVYLADADRTLHRCAGGESFQTAGADIAGGALLMSRQDLESVGGWRRIDRHVDLALRKDVVAAGGRIYRTHGAGFMLVRQRDRAWHTWKADDGRFLAEAERDAAGWHPDWASLGDIAHP